MRIWSFLLIFTLCVSCNRNTYEAPENLIEEDQMIEVLSEFMLLNAAKGMNKKILEKHIADPTQYIFDKYGIDSTQLANSNTYYAHNSEAYASIYEHLKKKLESDKKVLQDLVAKEKRIRDSIRKTKLVKPDSALDLKNQKLTLKNRLPSKRIEMLKK